MAISRICNHENTSDRIHGKPVPCSRDELVFGRGARIMFETRIDERPRLHLVARHTGETIELPGPNVLVGRHSEADLRLPFGDVSRRHCRFVHHDGHWRIIDLSSMNGTFVNDSRVNEADLQPGDEIRVANLVFELRPAA